MRLVGDELVHEFKLTNGTSLTAKHSQVKCNKAHHRLCKPACCFHASTIHVQAESRCMTFLPLSRKGHMAHPICKDMPAQSCITIRTAAADVLLSACCAEQLVWLCRKLWPLASNNLAALSRCDHNNKQRQVLISFLAHHQQQPPRLKCLACKQLASPWCRLSCLTWQTWAEAQGPVRLVPLPTRCHRGPSSRKVCTPGVCRGSTPCVCCHPR